MTHSVKRTDCAAPTPLVDLEAVCLRNEPSEEDYRRVGEEIAKAFEEKGYVYLTNHGLPKEKTERLIKSFDSFFDLGEEVKKKYKRDLDTLHGYLTDKEEKYTKSKDRLVSSRESFDFTGFEHGLPAEVPVLKDVISDFTAQSEHLVDRVMKAIGHGLGVPCKEFLEGHSPSKIFVDIRMLRYNPVLDDEVDQLRFEEHRDTGTTVTLQFFDDKGGLQVQDRDGNWIDTKITPETIYMHPGGFLQRWTADRIPAANHRVCIPGKEKRKDYRHSGIIFATANDSTVIRCLDKSDKYPPITVKEMLDKFRQEFYGSA